MKILNNSLIESCDLLNFLLEEDIGAIEQLLKETEVFYKAEIPVAKELALDAYLKSEASDYKFVLAKKEGKLLGYACYGKNSMTEFCYDLYWLAISPIAQKSGLGKMILSQIEQGVKEKGGRYLFAETSGTIAFLAARNFYHKNHFINLAEIPDFYKPNDTKIIYRKEL